MNRAQYIQSLKNGIENELYEVQNFINFKKSTNRDIHFISELFLEELLNQIYKGEGYNFKNINHEIPGYPAIDIADEKQGISYQVTVTNDSSDIKTKVNKTLELFYKNDLHKKYRELYIVIASGIKDRKKLPQKTIFKIDGRNVKIDPEIFTQKNIIDFIDIAKKEIFKRPAKFERISNVLQKIKSRPEKRIIPFNFERTYIERTVYDSGINQNPPLIDPVKRNRLNVLLGIGGLGKTTEVNLLANKISKCDEYFCFKTKLIDYANSLERHIDANCKNWRNVPQGYTTLIILDGLDEVNSLKFDTVYREIKEFSKLNPKIKILVTCRTNFNPFYSDQENSDDNDEVFNELLLKEISELDIENYIKKECSTSSIFLHAIKKSKIIDLLKNPFYLVNVVSIFNSNKIVPENKTIFFKELIKLRIKEEEKKNSSFKNNLDEFVLTQSLKVLALTMQFSGEYKIEKVDFERTIRNKETRENIKRIFFHENEDYWQFEHNNFQEFLAAEAISELDWAKIKNIILLPNNKLKPKWLNAFSFLVNLVPENSQLIPWFIENEIESFIKVEPEKMEPEIRNRVFKEIFEKHKNEETTIWKKNYEENDLADFVGLNENPILIKFLLDEIEAEDKNIQSISNAIHLLEQLNDPNQFKNEIQNKYLKLLTNKNNHKYGITYSILSSFSKWKMLDDDLKNKIIQIDALFLEGAPVSPLCHYLDDGKFTDITANTIYKIILSMEENRVVGSEFSLLKVIELLSADELSSLIQKLTPKDFKGLTRFWMNDLFKQINSRAIKLYHKDSPLVDSITDFVYSSFVYNDKEYAKEFKSFFEKTDLVYISFKTCFLNDLKSEKSKRREYFVLPAMLANHECLDWVVEYYVQNTFSDEMMWNFLISLNLVGNYEGHKYFLENIKEPTQKRFEPKPNPWIVFNNEKEDLYLKTLLDHNLALKFINKAFVAFKKDIVDRSEIMKKQLDKEDRYEDVELTVGLELISRHSKDKINRQNFIEWISKKEEWDYVVLDEYYNRITRHDLPEENFDWIFKWCENYKQKIQLKDAITIKKDDTFSYLNIVRFFIQYALFLDVSLSEEQFLELLSFLGLIEFRRNINNKTTEIRLYDYIKSHVDLKTLQNRILQNINNGKLVPLTLNEHVNILEKEKWIEETSFLVKHILNTKSPRYVKDNMLRVYKLYKGNSNDLIPALHNLTFKGEDSFFDWKFIDFMVEEKNPKAIEFLINKIGDTNFDQLKLGIYLMKAHQIKAFDLIIKNLNLLENHNENEFLTRTLNEIPCNIFGYKLFADFLIKVLNIYIIKNFGISGFNNILQILFNKLFEIITETEIEGEELIKIISELLDSCEKNETSRRARYELYELENKFNIHKDKGCQISDAIKELKTLGIEYEF